MGVDQLVTGGDVDNPVVESLTSDSLKADELSRGNGALIGDGTSFGQEDLGPDQIPGDTTSTTFVDKGELLGGFDSGRIPDGTTIYGRMQVNMRINNPASTGDRVRVRPLLVEPGVQGISIDSLETSTENTSFTKIDTGWTDISSDIPSSAFLSGSAFEVRVDSGTGQFENRRDHGVIFDFRVD